MTTEQQEISAFAIEKVTGFSKVSFPLLEQWVIEQGIEIQRNTHPVSFGSPSYTCIFVSGQVDLHKNSGYSKEGVFLQCLGEYCKNRLIKQMM
jgi:hypothetical protein